MSILDKIRKEYGPDAILSLDSIPDNEHKAIPTGSLCLDKALGGGIPIKRVTEIYANEGVGKSTLALHIIANAQQQGLTAVYIDAEHALDVTYAKQIGVNTTNMLIAQPTYGEQALNMVSSILEQDEEPACIVIDSVAALTPKAEIEAKADDVFIGLQARMLSTGLRKIINNLAKSECAVIFINQVRNNLAHFRPSVTTSGGKALKFYSSIRLELKKSENITVGRSPVGHIVKAKVTKNKVTAPFKEASFPILYGIGIDTSTDLVNAAIENKIVEQSGPWYQYKDVRVKGKLDLIKALQPFLEEIRHEVLAAGE